MAYLYEDMEMTKESIQSYNEEKCDLGYEKYLMIWDLIDKQWNEI